MSHNLVTIVLIFFLMVDNADIVSSVRIKISLNSDYQSEAGRFKRQSSCSQVRSISRKMLSSPPYNELPNDIISRLNNRVRFYHTTATAITDIQMRVVEGIREDVTVAVVLNALEKDGCFPFFYGGVVRDIFLDSANLADVDLEADCNPETVMDICSKNWGSENCYSNNPAIIHIGQVVNSLDDSIDVASTELTFYGEDSLLNLEYTVNSLALHGSIIIDLTGHGIEDVCARKIRIPSDDNSVQSWDNWRERSPVRLYRYWKLRTKRFTAVNQDTSGYVIAQTKLAITADNGNGFKKFYCTTVYKAKGYDVNTDSCTYNDEIPEMCATSATTTKVAKYDMAFLDDFEDYWTSALQNMIPSCLHMLGNDGMVVYIAIGL